MKAYVKAVSIALPIAIIVCHACTRAPKATPNAMDITWCETEPMKPFGRVTRIPAVAPSSNLGTLTGVVVQRETGDALSGAAVRLIPAAGSMGRPYSERYT